MERKIFEKYYCWEDLCDVERDVTEAMDPRFNPESVDIPGEFRGRIKLVMTYEGDENEG